MSSLFKCLSFRALLLWSSNVSVLFLGLPFAQADSPKFLMNQMGFLPNAAKVAVLPNCESGEFWLVSAEDNSDVLRGPLTQAAGWEAAQDLVKIADFSAFNKPGDYYLRVTGVGKSQTFTIAEKRFDSALRNIAKSFFLHRASAAMEPRYSAQYKRPAGHPDLLVARHKSLGSSNRRDIPLLESPRGWYDSGDYNKYTINTALTLYFMLQSFHHHNAFYSRLVLNIPESENHVPDLLDEIYWGLDWLLTMQDEDGGVYQRVGDTDVPAGLPSEQLDVRYVFAKSTQASLFFAALTAYAHHVFTENNVVYHYADNLIKSSEKAWQWAEEHPKQQFTQPSGVNSQMYAWANDNLADDRAWAAAELARATASRKYYKAVQFPDSVKPLQWQHVEALAILSVLESGQAPSSLQKQAQSLLSGTAQDYVNRYLDSGYLVPMNTADFVRGSNYLALNRAFMLLKLHQLQPDEQYFDAAYALLDYLFGRNPQAISYVTGVNGRSPQRIRDWISQYDAVPSPVPGLLVGGPFAAASDPCRYTSSAPAKRYLDEWCSEQTNQVSLAGSAALLYVLASLREASVN